MIKLYELLSSTPAKQWMENAAPVFLFLYAAFGLREARERLREAWTRIIELWRARLFAKLVIIGLSSILVALGPVYISFEAIQRALT